jgi:hypothetical protein
VQPSGGLAPSTSGTTLRALAQREILRREFDGRNTQPLQRLFAYPPPVEVPWLAKRTVENYRKLDQQLKNDFRALIAQVV